MNLIKKIGYFLGSIWFTFFLLFTTALVVIIGTILESHTESHLYASSFTYSHFFFNALLWGFFVNILISALRRYPFKFRHLPFLITHLGLLMILGGQLIKHRYGLQGVMKVIEGSGSNRVLIPDTFALQIEETNGRIGYLELSKNHAFKIADFHPHSKEIKKAWIKDQFAYIFGLNPIPVTTSATTPTLFKDSNGVIWHVYAIKTDQVKETAENVYLKHLKVNSNAKSELFFNYTEEGFKNPCLLCQETIALQGPTALLNASKIDISNQPTLLLIDDLNQNVHFFAYDQFGHVFSQKFTEDLPSVIAYNDGFAGYGTQFSLPAYFHINRTNKIEKRSARFLKELSQVPVEDLSIPLQIFSKAAEAIQGDFTTLFLEFLQNEANLSPKLQQLFTHIELPEKALYWMSTLISQSEGKLLNYLKEKNWPLLHLFEGVESEEEALHLLLKQMLAISDQLPDVGEIDPADLPHYYSIYLKAHGIDWNTILAHMEDDATHSPLTLEGPLHFSYEPLPPLQKLEDNVPMLTLLLPNSQKITLPYERDGDGLKHPIFNGNARLRFQPVVKNIPFRVRLREARTIYNPNSSSPHSYEADLYISDKEEQIEKTISMNNVYETVTGYRFYLSHIAQKEGDIRKVHLAVNYDPAKYLLTYPGGILITLGVIWLLWFNPYKRN